jgi:hypothetical protein
VGTAEEEQRKKAIFESMSAKSRKRILDRGYEEWDPFLAPKDPLDMTMNKRRETALSLMRRFLHSRSEACSKPYCQGAWEICLGIVGGDDRSKGISDFCVWYRDITKNGER